MNIIEKIKEFLEGLDTRDFYKYAGIAVGILCLLTFFMMYRFYSKVDYYNKQIRNLNNDRQEVQELLEKAAAVKQQKADVNAMLEADPNFKIAGYFKDILTQLGLENKQISSTVTTQERGEEDYNESILTAKFGDMNMRELSELLNVLEQNKRVYTKELEVQKSRKSPRAIEVQLTIATLQPRTG